MPKSSPLFRGWLITFKNLMAIFTVQTVYVNNQEEAIVNGQAQLNMQQKHGSDFK